MIINKTPRTFSPVTVTFNDESELHDVLAALAAYATKQSKVSGTGLAEQFKLGKYTGNARETVNRVLPELVAAL